MSLSELEEIVLERYSIDEFVELVDLRLEQLLELWDGWIDNKDLREDLGLDEIYGE